MLLPFTKFGSIFCISSLAPQSKSKNYDVLKYTFELALCLLWIKPIFLHDYNDVFELRTIEEWKLICFICLISNSYLSNILWLIFYTEVGFKSFQSNEQVQKNLYWFVISSESARFHYELAHTLLSPTGLLAVPGGGTRGGGNFNLGVLDVPDEEEDDDEVEGLRVNKGFRPANKWVTEFPMPDVEEEGELDVPEFEDWPPPLVATVQNMTCACFCLSRSLAYCFLNAAISNWSLSFSWLECVPEDEDELCCAADLRKVMSLIRRPVCRNRADEVIKPPNTVATAFIAFVFSSSSSSSASPSGSSSL